MKLARLSTCVITLLALLALWSCGSKGTTESAGDSTETALTLDTIKWPPPGIPSPHEIPYLLESTGAEFNVSLLNSRNKAEAYLARNDKAALNLGIYATDIGYLISYDKTQEAIDYLNTSKRLADDLGVIGAFDPDMLTKFEKYISNKDTLAGLIDDAVKKTGNYLNDDNRKKLAAMLITGSFTEGLYISTGLIKSFPKTLLPADQRNLVLQPLMRIILDQKKSVSELNKVLATLDQAEPIGGIVTQLHALETAYSQLNIEEQIKKGQTGEALSDKNLEEITKIVDKLRSSITD